MKDYTGPNTLLSAFQLIRQELKAASGGSGGCVPIGTIVIWSGTAENIPAGWALCDGQDGRPDLRDRFVLGAGAVHAVGETGGSEEVTLTELQMPMHNHGIRLHNVTSSATGSGKNVLSGYDTYSSNTVNAGHSQPHNNMPPYYALCYIIKTEDGISAPAFESYDTEDGWHVRKWDDGYLELCGTFAHAEDGNWGSWGSSGVSTMLLKSFPFPMPLVKKYYESVSITAAGGNSTLSTAWIALAGGPEMPPGPNLTNINRYYACRIGAPSVSDTAVSVFVSGKWK